MRTILIALFSLLPLASPACPGINEICTETFTTQNDTYQEVTRFDNHFPLTSKISFSVRLCEGATILLTKNGRGTLPNYEIIIGIDNRSSKIYKNNTLSEAVSHKDRPLDCHVFLHLYMSWKEGMIEVGFQKPSPNKGVLVEEPFLMFWDRHPFEVRRMFVKSSSQTPPGEWIFKLPCPKPCITETKFTTVATSENIHLVHGPKQARGVTTTSNTTTKFHPLIPPQNIDINSLYRLDFAAKICDNAVIRLGPNHPSPHSAFPFYIFAIGNPQNEIVMTRKSKIVAQTTLSANLLDCDRFVRFYISWAYGTIEIGMRHPDPEKRWGIIDDSKLSYVDPSPLKISAVDVAGSMFDGRWIFEFPNPEYILYQTTLTTQTATKVETLHRKIAQDILCDGKCDQTTKTCFCYTLSKQRFTFSEAEMYCRSRGGQVAVLDITNQQDRNLTERMLSKLKYGYASNGEKAALPDGLWIRNGLVNRQGLRSYVTFMRDATLPPPATHSCITARDHHGKVTWFPEKCTDQYGVICQMAVVSSNLLEV